MASLLLAVGLLGACERTVGVEGQDCCGEETWIYPQSDHREVDLLFVMDNSGSMEGELEQLRVGFESLMGALGELPGGVPNVHIGVTSSDLGAGPDGTTYCSDTGGDGGRLLTGACAQPVGVPYIVDVAPVGCEIARDAYNLCSADDCLPQHCQHEPTTALVVDPRTGCPRCRNIGDEALGDVFGCLADLGTTGCSFEQPLEAVVRALDPQNTANTGFLRDGAILGIVLITDEDDCSAADAHLFDSTDTSVDSPLGPLSSFRCFEFGITCDVDDREHTGLRHNCVSRPASTSLLHPVSRYLDRLRQERSRRPLILAAIAGPVTPSYGGLGYDVLVARDAQGLPAVEPSCTTEPEPPDPLSGAVPGVRLHEVVAGLGSAQDLETWAYTSVCSGSYSAPLGGLGLQVAEMMEHQCLPSPVSGCADPGVELGAPQADLHCDANSQCVADCDVADLRAYGLPQQERLAVPPCLEVGTDGARLSGNTDRSLAYDQGHPEARDPDLPVSACWYIRYQWACAAAHGAELVISRRQDPPPRTVAEITCQVLPPYEQYCANGRDDDQNCLTDLADPCCMDPAACGR